MTLYDDAGGYDGLLKLCVRWHDLCLADPVAEHPFSHEGGHPHHNERLAAYLSEAFGGPELYTAGYGDESKVQRMHAGNGEHKELDEICLGLFDQAIADVGMTGDTAERIAAYFRASTIAMRRYEHGAELVPDAMPFNYA